MKQTLIAVLLLLPLSAIATPVDSMFGPFKLPFEIGVTVHGHFRWTSGAVYPTVPKEFGQTITVDSLGTYTHIHPTNSSGTHGVDTIKAFRIGDTLRYEYASIDTTPGSSELLFSRATRGFDIVYDSANKLIPWIHCWSNSNTSGQYDGTYDDVAWSADLSHFQFDRDSIFADNSDISKHLDTAIYNEDGKTQHDPLYEYWVWLDTASSVDLSGNFAASHLGLASVAAPGTGTVFSVCEQDGSLICDFSPTDQARTLEVYSVIGSLVTRFDIRSGSTTASLALPKGCYFLRMDGSVMKVYVA